MPKSKEQHADVAVADQDGRHAPRNKLDAVTNQWSQCRTKMDAMDAGMLIMNRQRFLTLSSLVEGLN